MSMLKLEDGDLLVVRDDFSTLVAPRTLEEEVHILKENWTAKYGRANFEAGDSLVVVEVRDPLVSVMCKDKKQYVLYAYELQNRVDVQT